MGFLIKTVCASALFFVLLAMNNLAMMNKIIKTDAYTRMICSIIFVIAMVGAVIWMFLNLTALIIFILDGGFSIGICWE